MKARFVGGPIDGEVRQTGGATYYRVPMIVGEEAPRTAVYRRHRLAHSERCVPPNCSCPSPPYEYRYVEVLE